jgi:hypothetical protein
MRLKIQKLGAQKRLMWLANIVFATIMTVIVFCALFGESSEIAKSGFFLELIIASGLLVALLFGYRKLIPKIERWSKRKMLILELAWFALIAGMVAYFTVKLCVAHFSWDPMFVRSGVDDLVAGKNLDNYYYNWYPYQRSLVYFVFPFVKIIRVLGLGIHTHIILMAVNAAAVFVTVLFAYLAIRTWLGRERALFWLMLAPILLLPLLLYSPIYYTDTLSAVFVALSFFILMKLYKGCKHPRILALMLGIACFFGMQVKATAVILVIAVAIVMLLKLKYEMIPRYLAIMTIAILGFVPLTLAWNSFRDGQSSHPEMAVPIAHYVAMGLKGDGGFNDEDASDAARVIAEGGDIKQFETDKIKQRLADYGVGGYMVFAARKISYTWGDGMYYAQNKLSRNPYDSSSLIANFIYGEHREATAFVTGAVHLMMLLLFVYAGWKTLKSFNPVVAILKLCVCGVFIFFIIWEARSRYLLNYLPLFTILEFAFLWLQEPKPKVHRYRAK